MKLLKLAIMLLFIAVFTLSIASNSIVESQDPGADEPIILTDIPGTTTNEAPGEAPAGFDNKTIDPNFVTQADFDIALADFAEIEEIDEGLGPVFNSASCGECHNNPVIGGISQITELRAGHLDFNGTFVAATATVMDGATPIFITNRSLINARGVCPSEEFPDKDAQERITTTENIRAFRATLNVLGDGFVEAILDSTFVIIRNNQPVGMQGQIIMVPVEESPGVNRVGRFGWKNQIPSLLTFSGEAYLNEMGITNRLFPFDVTNLCDGNPNDPEDGTPDPNDEEAIDLFAKFMRASKVPPRNVPLANTADAKAGAILFNSVGCTICHTAQIVTAPVGTIINGGNFTVPAALGNKIIRPFGDFLLHNVGTGDGIVQNGPQSTRNKVRTPPLWGVRTRNRLMHDGESLTFNEAILRHRGEANNVINSFRNLSNAQKQQLVTFLRSL